MHLREIKKMIDIGVNLTDGMYKGFYNNKVHHVSDIDLLIERAKKNNVTKMIVTGGSLEDSKLALELANQYENIYSTVGCHPTRSKDFESHPEQYLNALSNLIKSCSKVVAVGECGLDYDRLHFCPKEIQIKYFELQLTLAKLYHLPLFLHSRNCHQDFIDILRRNVEYISKGAVVHSFTGTEVEMRECLELGPQIYIGVNGCSLKTEANLLVASRIPTERLLLETDGPWCEIKPSHASYKYVKTHFPSKKKEKFESGIMVKGRNEPCTLVQVLEALTGCRNEKDPQALADKIYQNTLDLFFTP